MTNSKALSRGQEEGQALSLKHIFGVNASASGSTIGYTDDTSAVYVAGRTLILYNTADNRQKVLTQGTYITALAFTRNRKYTAVAFDNSPHTGAPTVVVYETSSFRRKRQLSYPDMHSRRIISMAFSLDGRILVVQGGAPDYKLIMWSLDTKAARGTPLAVAHVSSSEKEPIHQVSVNPRDSTQVCVSGNGVVKFLRYTDGALKPVTTAPPKMREAYNYLCHAWMPMAHFTGESGTEDGTPRVVMGTETGELVLFENYEMKTVLPESPADNLAIYALEPTGKGFLCAGEKGIVSWYQSRYLTDASESSGTEGTMGKDQVYRRQRCLKVDTDRRSEEKMTPLETEDTTVRGMAVSPGEETVMLVTERGQIHTLNLSSSSAADLLPTQDEFYFDLMAGPFHVGGVTDIDACVRKPFLVTCGRDRTVRLWNYREHTAEHVQEFHVEPLTVTIHPSGMYVVVGFADKVRFMSVVGHYELVEVKALSIRNSSRCRFAHGGHMFAAVHGNVVQIYDTYTLRSVATLRGHSSRVRHVYWLRGDGGLVSMSIDGSVFEWRIEFPSLGIDASSSSSSSSSALASASSPGSIMGESKAVRVGEMAVKRQQTTAVHGSIGTGGGGSTTRTGDDSGGTIGMRTGTGTDAGTKHVSAVLVSVQQGVVTVGLGDGGIDVVSVAGRKASDAGHYNRRGHGNKDHDDDGGGGRGNDNDNNNNNTLIRLVESESSNFIIKCILETGNKAVARHIFTTLLPRLSDLWHRQRRRGVVIALTAACARFDMHQNKMIKALQDMVSSAEDYTGPTTFIKALLFSHWRIEAPAVLLLNELFKFKPKRINKMIHKGMLELSTEELFQLAIDNCGSRFLQDYLDAPIPGKDNLNNKTQIIARLRSRFVELSMNKHAAYVVEKCVLHAPPQLKQRIAEELLNEESKVMNDTYGSIVFLKCRINQFKNESQDWIKKQEKEQKTLEMFQDIIHDDVVAENADDKKQKKKKNKKNKKEKYNPKNRKQKSSTKDQDQEEKESGNEIDAIFDSNSENHNEVNNNHENDENDDISSSSEDEELKSKRKKEKKKKKNEKKTKKSKRKVEEEFDSDSYDEDHDIEMKPVQQDDEDEKEKKKKKKDKKEKKDKKKDKKRKRSKIDDNDDKNEDEKPKKKKKRKSKKE
eukprot:gb/GECH01010082.1/.p1 GENE.gb/GECH01010082.1/~~gb/GECH01010082.1/.p1  ORF type:complete len:1152 (+),score=347.62 gb/GECH01010082.1/:1-3456(+)